MSGWFGGSKGSGVAAAKGEGGKLSPENDPDTIHIFTIASGHMYERLQKIMILSLIRNTKCGPLLLRPDDRSHPGHARMCRVRERQLLQRWQQEAGLQASTAD